MPGGLVELGSLLFDRSDIAIGGLPVWPAVELPWLADAQFQSSNDTTRYACMAPTECPLVAHDRFCKQYLRPMLPQPEVVVFVDDQ